MTELENIVSGEAVEEVRAVAEYEVTEEMQRKQINGLFLHMYRNLLILLPITFVLSLLWTIASYVIEREFANTIMRILGYAGIALSLFSAVCFSFSYFKTKKQLMSAFRMNSESGKQRIRVEQTETGYVVTNLTKGKAQSLVYGDIASVVASKHALMLYLRSKQTMLLARNNEITKMFQQYFGERGKR